VVCIALDRLDEPVVGVVVQGGLFVLLQRVSSAQASPLFPLRTASRSFRSIRMSLRTRFATSCRMFMYLILDGRLRCDGTGSSESSTMSYSSSLPLPLRFRPSSCSSASVDEDLKCLRKSTKAAVVAQPGSLCLCLCLGSAQCLPTFLLLVVDQRLLGKQRHCVSECLR
jgi:hypothetical protein